MASSADLSIDYAVFDGGGGLLGKTAGMGDIARCQELVPSVCEATGHAPAGFIYCDRPDVFAGILGIIPRPGLPDFDCVVIASLPRDVFAEHLKGDFLHLFRWIDRHNRGNLKLDLSTDPPSLPTPLAALQVPVVHQEQVTPGEVPRRVFATIAYALFEANRDLCIASDDAAKPLQYVRATALRLAPFYPDRAGLNLLTAGTRRNPWFQIYLSPRTITNCINIVLTGSGERIQGVSDIELEPYGVLLDYLDSQSHSDVERARQLIMNACTIQDKPQQVFRLLEPYRGRSQTGTAPTPGEIGGRTTTRETLPPDRAPDAQVLPPLEWLKDLLDKPAEHVEQAFQSVKSAPVIADLMKKSCDEKKVATDLRTALRKLRCEGESRVDFSTCFLLIEPQKRDGVLRSLIDLLDATQAIDLKMSLIEGRFSNGETRDTGDLARGDRVRKAVREFLRARILEAGAGDDLGAGFARYQRYSTLYPSVFKSHVYRPMLQNLAQNIVAGYFKRADQA